MVLFCICVRVFWIMLFCDMYWNFVLFKFCFIWFIFLFKVDEVFVYSLFGFVMWNWYVYDLLLDGFLELGLGWGVLVVVIFGFCVVVVVWIFSFVGNGLMGMNWVEYVVNVIKRIVSLLYIVMFRLVVLM